MHLGHVEQVKTFIDPYVRLLAIFFGLGCVSYIVIGMWMVLLHMVKEILFG